MSPALLLASVKLKATIYLWVIGVYNVVNSPPKQKAPHLLPTFVGPTGSPTEPALRFWVIVRRCLWKPKRKLKDLLRDIACATNGA